MHASQATISLKGIGMLLRIIAVAFSSVATILSTLLPLFFHYTLSAYAITITFVILLTGTILIHGILTHAFNDITDHYSGTDQHSPGLLSGGSKVIQTETIAVHSLMRLGMAVTIILLIFTAIFFLFQHPKFAILTLVGLCSAISYSMKPLPFAYYPFIGEWFSLFPAMLVLGIAPPWILLDTIPTWAWQNALINAIWCMAWVMIHHIPDRHADRQAHPMKRTSVVWAEDFFGERGVKLPALAYFSLIFLLLLSMIFTRPISALGASIILFYSIYITTKMEINDVHDVTKVEKQLLLFAFITAIWLGVFI